MVRHVILQSTGFLSTSQEDEEVGVCEAGGTCWWTVQLAEQEEPQCTLCSSKVGPGADYFVSWCSWSGNIPGTAWCPVTTQRWSQESVPLV